MNELAFKITVFSTIQIIPTAKVHHKPPVDTLTEPFYSQPTIFMALYKPF